MNNQFISCLLKYREGNFKKGKRGLTLVEILVVLAIMAVLSTIVFDSFASLKNNREVNTSAHGVEMLLAEARSLTLSSKEASRYGVHFTSNSATLYQNSYTEGNSENKVVTVESPAVISTISLNGGGDNLLFNRLTGETAQYGSVIITSTADSNQIKTITIHQSGLVEIN